MGTQKDSYPLRALLTGAHGYLGRHTVLEFFKNGIPVIPIPRFREFDISTTKSFLHSLPPHPNSVLLHLASAHPLQFSDHEIHGLYLSNVKMAQLAAAIAEELHCRKVIFSSTALIYETPSEIERNAYVESKLQSEETLSSSLNQAGIPLTSIRFEKLAGGRKTEKLGLFNALQTAIREGSRFHIHLNRALFKDFLHVEDAAKCLLTTVDEPAIEGAFRAGTNEKHSIFDIIFHCEELLMRKIAVDARPPEDLPLKTPFSHPEDLQRFTSWRPTRSEIDRIIFEEMAPFFWNLH